MAEEADKQRLREEIAQEKFGKSFEDLDSDEVGGPSSVSALPKACVYSGSLRVSQSSGPFSA